MRPKTSKAEAGRTGCTDRPAGLVPSLSPNHLLVLSEPFIWPAPFGHLVARGRRGARTNSGNRPQKSKDLRPFSQIQTSNGQPESISLLWVLLLAPQRVPAAHQSITLHPQGPMHSPQQRQQQYAYNSAPTSPGTP